MTKPLQWNLDIMEHERAGKKKNVRYNKVIEVLLHCTIAEMKNIVPRTYFIEVCYIEVPL